MIFVLICKYFIKYRIFSFSAQIGLDLRVNDFRPRDVTNTEDTSASERAFVFNTGVFTEPLLGGGQFPSDVTSRLSTKLSSLTPAEIGQIKGTN